METGSTFSEWRDRILVRSLQAHQRWRSRWHPSFRRLFTGSTQNWLTDNATVNTTSSQDTTGSPHETAGGSDADDNGKSMPDNNGVSNNGVETVGSALKTIREDAATDTKSVFGEDMSVQPDPAVKREGLVLSASHDSITVEEIPGLGTIILTTVPEDSGPQLETDMAVRCSEGAGEPECGGEGPVIRVIPPTLALDIRPVAGSSAARKSPVTVQEWVDSLPPPCIQASNTPETWPLPRQTASLVRESSVQSDAGSHCSSVESLLGSRRADPEQVLMGLGFGGGVDCESNVSRIPKRFLQPSKVKGVNIDDFLKHQQDLVHNFESGYNGYRGLTGTGQRQSVIVAKIMEKLRGGSCRSDSPPPSPAGKRFSKVARKVMNVLPSSVLTPDNRRFLDGQGGKSPEVPRKRMIIGQRSFTIDRDGDLIELYSATNNISISSNENNKSITKDHVLSPSLSLSSGEQEENRSKAQNLASDRRSLSLDSSEAPPAHSTPKVNLMEVSHTVPSELEFSSFKPDFSVSSRSASIDSTDSPSLMQRPLQSCSEIPWDIPLSQRRNRFSSTSLSSWESMSPKGDYDRPFPRYESIEETSEKGDLSSEPSVSTSNEEVKMSLQLRRGSLKRQQHVDEDVLPNSDTIEHILEECEVFTSSSHDTLSQPCEDSVSMNSSLMEQLLNPDKSQQSREKTDVSDESLQVPSLEADVGTASQPVTESAPHQFDSDNEIQMRVVSTLMRARSDSSGFLDLEGDAPCSVERNAMAAIERNQRELDDLVQELKERGVTTGRCRDTAVRLALTSYGDQLKGENDAKMDIPDARYDLETLCQLREMVAAELRRVADLLDEQPSATGIPIVTTQMTALLREQTKLRRQLEALNCDPPSSLDNVPSCCDMLSLVRNEHRHLENLVEQNSRELANIRQLLHELLATQR